MTTILNKGQLLETEQMFRDAGEQWPVIIPEEEIRQAAPGTKNFFLQAMSHSCFLHFFVCPRYALNDVGSGSHVHLSLWENGENVFMASGGHSKHGMSKVGEEFMAGVLNHLPSILAFTAPIPNSYDCIVPNMWSGAYQCWGKENREAPLRTACPPGVPNGVVSNFEIKAFDGCANPHLGLAAIIAAGIDGLRRHLSLPEPIGK
ncbi:type-1 glutamine synthetase 1-like [Camellia sinensis]|uniref:type-1 glutamine synthetase 1-like n=1 Tax=Camellia sinensis TaxID=4442 RepID=UPI0010362628|nr:type-1 glutamine synthetase 1-like [Camellia sinensis]